MCFLPLYRLFLLFLHYLNNDFNPNNIITNVFLCNGIPFQNGLPSGEQLKLNKFLNFHLIIKINFKIVQ